MRARPLKPTVRHEPQRVHAGAVDIRRAEEGDRPAMAAFAARLQERPDAHVAYLDVEAPALAEEMIADDDDWTAVTALASDGDRLVGWLMGSVDVDLGRVWWFGPFVDAPMLDDWIDRVDALYASCVGLLPDDVSDEEFAPDARFTRLVRWAISQGFVRDADSAVLVLDRDVDAGGSSVGSGELAVGSVRRLDAPDETALAAMHDTMFAGTHTTASGLLAGADDDHLRLGLEVGDRLVGYVAVERQPGGDGYIDFVGVDPELRGRGYGERLVRAGIDALRARGCGRISLTVREDNPAARALYRRLGFQEERVIAALRRTAPSR